VTALKRGQRIVLAMIMAGAAALVARSEETVGTFSIIAYDAETEEWGVAVESRAFSVGSAVPWAEAGVGAIATQSQTNRSFGPQGLAMMRSGLTAAQALRALLDADPGRENRQAGIVDASGNSASFTGSKCSDWAGDTTAPGLAIQGNILVGPEVVRGMARAYAETTGELAERLLAALKAGQAAGGDRRGQQSAAILVVRSSDRYPEYRNRYVDLRVEDSASPIVELERVYRILETEDLLQAHVRYAQLYDSLGQGERAQRERQRIGETLRRVTASGTRDAGVLNSLAWFCALGNIHLEDALKAAQAAVEIEQQNTGIIDTLAEVYFRMGRPAEAITAIERALTISPKDTYLLGQRERFRSGATPTK
jgi:uncharacterized Ntn-hydrolase superfamily protein